MTAITETREHLGVASMTGILTLLSTRAMSELTPNEMEWLTDSASTIIEMEAANLTKITAGLGFLIAGDEDIGNFQNKEEVSCLLFNLSTQLDTLHGLSFVANQARYLNMVNAGHKKTD